MVPPHAARSVRFLVPVIRFEDKSTTQPTVNKGFTILVFPISFLVPHCSLGTVVEVYSQSGCVDCEWVQESFLPEAEARFGTNLESRVRDIAEKENFLRLLGVLDRAGLPRGQTLSAPYHVSNPLLRSLREHDFRVIPLPLNLP